MIVRGLKTVRLESGGEGGAGIRLCGRSECPCALRDGLGVGDLVGQGATQPVQGKVHGASAQGLQQPGSGRVQSVDGVSEAGDRRRHAGSR